MREIPIRTSTGEEIRPSPGRHNRLQGQVMTDFGPRFAPGSTLLYLGDAANKLLHLDRDHLAHLGVPITEHDKLPDVVLYDEERNWLFLIKAVTSSRPRDSETGRRAGSQCLPGPSAVQIACRQDRTGDRGLDRRDSRPPDPFQRRQVSWPRQISRSCRIEQMRSARCGTALKKTPAIDSNSNAGS